MRDDEPTPVTTDDTTSGGPAYGRWSHDLATGTWWISPEVVAMWDIGIGTDGPIEVVLERLHPDDRPLIQEHLTRTLVDGAPLAGQGRLLTEHGERIFAFYGDVVDGEEGGGGKVVTGCSIDVTDHARRTLQEAVVGMRRHGQAIEHLKGALMVVYAVDEPEAFNLLRTVSMEHNVKLNLVAERAMAMASTQAGRTTSLIELVAEAARTVASRTSTSRPPRRDRRVVVERPADLPRTPAPKL